MSSVTKDRTTPLATEDAARLHMSVAKSPMLITALLLLDRPIAHEALEVRLELRLLRHRRFRQRIIEPRLGLGMPRWADDPSFDVRHHVHRIDPTLLMSPPALERLVSDLVSMPLGRRHPLWRAHLIDGPEPALVMLVHHALADGAALLRVLNELADERPQDDGTRSATASPPRLSRAREIAAGAGAAGRLVLRPPDPETILNRAPPAGEKHLGYSTKLPLSSLRETAHVLGTTITGVLLVAVTGTLRSVLGVNEARKAGVLHALVPVDLRAGSTAMGNHYGSVFAPLPVGTDDLGARIRQIRETTRSLGSHSAGAAGARLAAAAGAMSAMVERLGVELFSRRASTVVSSVRGPTSELHLCGVGIRDLVVWAPASGNIAVSVTLMSYAGGVRVGVSTDARVIADAGQVVRELELELDRIRTFAFMSTT